jgi:hypothetical protein
MENSPKDTRLSTTSKSPLALARTALEAAREAIPQYSSRFSRHDYTQHQLYALVALRRLLKTDYRGLEATLRDWAELRDALGLSRVPDHSTIQRAERRLNANAKSKSRPKPRRTPDRPEAKPLFDHSDAATGTATATVIVPAPIAGTAA